jgi:hypothetical protein
MAFESYYGTGLLTQQYPYGDSLADAATIAKGWTL